MTLGKAIVSGVAGHRLLSIVLLVTDTLLPLKGGEGRAQDHRDHRAVRDSRDHMRQGTRFDSPWDCLRVPEHSRKGGAFFTVAIQYLKPE